MIQPFLVRSVRMEVPVEKVLGDDGARPLVLWQAAPTGPCPAGRRRDPDIKVDRCIACEAGKYNGGNLDELKTTCFGALKCAIWFLQ